MAKKNERTWFDPETHIPNIRIRTEVLTPLGIIVECWFDPETETFRSITSETLIDNVVKWRFH